DRMRDIIPDIDRQGISHCWSVLKMYVCMYFCLFQITSFGLLVSVGSMCFSYIKNTSLVNWMVKEPDLVHVFSASMPFFSSASFSLLF
uniref:Uncharacterized protein n=1 Tax=Scleropages formosus TaxID=113540 RepID=A0A8C9SZ54_SCLFO